VAGVSVGMVVTDNKMKMKMKMSIKEAMWSALADHREHGRLTLPNPAIVRNGAGFEYVSSLEPHGGVVVDLDGDLGWWAAGQVEGVGIHEISWERQLLFGLRRGEPRR